MSKPSDVWEIRHPTKAEVVSTAKNCGYGEKALNSLREHGYSLYCNGKCVLPRKPQKGGST